MTPKVQDTLTLLTTQNSKTSLKPRFSSVFGPQKPWEKNQTKNRNSNSNSNTFLPQKPFNKTTYDLYLDMICLHKEPTISLYNFGLLLQTPTISLKALKWQQPISSFFFVFLTCLLSYFSIGRLKVCFFLLLLLFFKVSRRVLFFNKF